MAKRIKQFILFIVVCGIIYGLMSHHIIFYGRHVKFLKKAELTLEYTFFSVTPTEFRTPELILRDKVLRDAGVGDILVEFGIITYEQKAQIEDKIDSEYL